MIGNIPMVKMPDSDIKRLRVLILRACLDKNGKTKQELLKGEVLEDYPQRFAEQTIMELVRGFQRSGFLYQRGNTHAAIYFLSVSGKEALERFEKELKQGA